MVWPINRRRPVKDAPVVTEADRRLITEALQAGRVTRCPTRAAPVVRSTVFGTRDPVAQTMEAAELLRVELSA